ncbi:putative aldo/keto reductase [Gordonia polyisoprenivorans NBRC 16320 = JCM 10675]|uniref:Aldo/keto reductase n=1 Tax=Gordonia polyisoprenivorans TaxID=84595 RepID=A0A846WIK9_9ACTN|nr:aldo/keto reductase [Gordonia polyisoprenivorans]NKY00700.1 aldo/keto reductase [Gordonia polyisoprenivorans]GAB22799.1 putative aldo/keto reductase [Gordonia polyisoprenivorans NBRC 16320 = JCM 10675]
MSTDSLVLGCMYFGTRTDDATSRALVERFLERGGTTLDTADCYAFWASGTGSGGQSEEMLGRWFADNPGVRERVTLATKVGPEPVPGRPGEVVGLGHEVVMRSIEASLARLQVDHIDLYWAHLEDRRTPMAEVVSTFGRLVDDGVVGRIGISNHPTWRVEQARALASVAGTEPFTALQLSTSYVRPRPDTVVPGKDHRFGFVTDETIDYVTTHPEIELWAYSPLIQGSFDRADRPFPEAYDHPGTTRRLAELRSVAAELDATPGQVVLAWLLGGSPVIRPIVGVSTLAQLDAALDAAELTLTAEQRARLDAAV